MCVEVCSRPPRSGGHHCKWEVVKEIKIPRSANFLDYAGMVSLAT
jgi:hypothetical protein